MELSLHYDAWGQLVYTDAIGATHVGVEPVRAFPISEPGQGIAILDGHGRELAWIDDLESLSPAQRGFLEEELSRRHFLPIVTKLHAIEGLTDPTMWDIDTDRGRTQFQVKNGEDIRRIAGCRVVVVDAHGIRYLIPDYRKLDASSRRLLERYI